MKRIILAFAFVLGSITVSMAACPANLAVMHDFPGSAFNMGLLSDPNGNCQSYVAPTQGGAVLSATNGWYSNILQGNAALSATNGIYANILQGNAVNALANPFFVSPGTGATFPASIAAGQVASGAYSAGSYAAGALAAGAFASGAGVDGWDLTQGAKGDAVCATSNGTCSVVALIKFLNAQAATIATNTGAAIPAGSAIIGKVGIDQTTPGTTNGVQLPTTSNGGAATVKGGVGVVNGGSFYQAVAASQTAAVLQSSTGAAGDYLSHCVIYPTSTSPGAVTVFDNTNTAATSAILFAGGASSASNLTPIAVPVGAVSTAGAWKVTTGSAVSVVCYGKFS